MAVSGQMCPPAIGGRHAGKKRKGKGRRARGVRDGERVFGVMQDTQVLPKGEEGERSP
jgi:hypothetical protein